MKPITLLTAFEKIKLLADTRRLDLLRRLLTAPATLSQLAQAVGQSPAWVRHHIKTLEAAGLVEISDMRPTSSFIEKYYRACADGFLVQEMILPQTQKPFAIFAGSNDLALEALAESLENHILLLSLPVGSLGGLTSLRQGLCQFSGTHILDETGEYNRPLVRRLFPEHNMQMMTVAYRTQGLITAPGNPKTIRGLSDLLRADLTFINRNAGSGTRIWLEQELSRLKLPTPTIRGYQTSVSTHREAAQAVATGKADFTLGLQAAAAERELGFVPLFEERYDLVFSLENQNLLAPVLNALQTALFRQRIHALTGYNTLHSGEQISV